VMRFFIATSIVLFDGFVFENETTADCNPSHAINSLVLLLAQNGTDRKKSRCGVMP